MSRAPIKKLVQAAAVAAFVVVSLAGCVRMHATTTVKSDNTLDQELIMAIDVSAFAELGEGGEAPRAEEYLQEIPADLRDRATVEDYQDGDYEGIHAKFKGITIDEFNSGAADTGGDELGIGASGASLERDGDEFILTIPLEPAGEDELGSPADYAEFMDIKMVYVFPGAVKSATAGEIEGNTVTFGAADLYGAEDITVVAGATSGAFWLIFVIIGVVVLFLLAAIAAVVIIVVVRGRRGASADEAASDAATPAVEAPAARPAPEEPSAPQS